MDALERAQRACAGIDTSRPGAVGLMVKHFEAADQEAVLREREACAQVADNPLTAMMIRQRGDRCCVKCGHSISEAMSQAVGLCSDCNHARLREALEAKIAEDKALETANLFVNLGASGLRTRSGPAVNDDTDAPSASEVVGPEKNPFDNWPSAKHGGVGDPLECLGGGGGSSQTVEEAVEREKAAMAELFDKAVMKEWSDNNKIPGIEPVSHWLTKEPSANTQGGGAGGSGNTAEEFNKGYSGDPLAAWRAGEKAEKRMIRVLIYDADGNEFMDVFKNAEIVKEMKNGRREIHIKELLWSDPQPVEVGTKP